jgi:hypothetical protein
MLGGKRILKDIDVDGMILQMTAKEDGEGIWTGLASVTQNRNQCWPIVNVLMNFWFQKAGKGEGLTT